MSKSAIAKLVDTDELMTFEKNDQFLLFINQEPPKSWIKPHPIAKNVSYLPIDKVELLLNRIFQEWRVEILREGQLLNSIYVTVRLHYKHPITGWTYHDGTAAAPIKTDKGENASNMAAIKSDAIQTGLPAAKSFAIKDAADNIGNIFGGNLNRKDTLGFSGMYSGGEEDEEQKKVQQAIKDLSVPKNLEELSKVFMGLGRLKLNQEVVEFKDKRKKELSE